MSQSEKPNLAFKYVAKASEVKRLIGNVEKSIANGDRVILRGDLDLPTSTRYQGPAWKACVDSRGQLLWSVRAEEHLGGRTEPRDQEVR